jgi:hypothetical protein
VDRVYSVLERCFFVLSMDVLSFGFVGSQDLATFSDAHGLLVGKRQECCNLWLCSGSPDRVQSFKNGRWPHIKLCTVFFLETLDR